MKSRVAVFVLVSLALSACSMPRIWPFHRKAKPAPEVVHELDLVNADGTPASFPQYWKRNTLVIDLSGVAGTGAVTARLPAESTWPVRVAVRVQPGAVQKIEVQAEERNVLPVAAEGLGPIDLEFAPSLYRATTAAIYISWGPMPRFAEAVIESDAGFVSPTEVPRSAPAPAAPTPVTEPSPPGGTGASDIIEPSEAAPAQPESPPGG